MSEVPFELGRVAQFAPRRVSQTFIELISSLKKEQEISVGLINVARGAVIPLDVFFKMVIISLSLSNHKRQCTQYGRGLAP